MDVWTLGKRYEAQKKYIDDLEERVSYIEEYLSNLTKDNNETVSSKKDKSPSVRTRRRTAKKSKSSK